MQLHTYADNKRVFWICMNLSENCMDYVHFTNDKLKGFYQWKGRLDIQNIVMIGLSDELPEHDEKYELHRLLGALLSKCLSATEKLNIIASEYNIPIGDNIREDVSVMCNLSQEIREDAHAETRAEIIMNMYRKGYAMEQISDIVEKASRK